MANAVLSAYWRCCCVRLRAERLSAQTSSHPRDGIPVHMLVTAEPHHGTDVPVVNREDVMVFEG
jgi:hypothetical protein